MLLFRVIKKGQSIPSLGRGTGYLKVDHWNDFSFTTMFHFSLHDHNGEYHSIGPIKIGFRSQDESISTYRKLPD